MSTQYFFFLKKLNDGTYTLEHHNFKDKKEKNDVLKTYIVIKFYTHNFNCYNLLIDTNHYHIMSPMLLYIIDNLFDNEFFTDITYCDKSKKIPSITQEYNTFINIINMCIKEYSKQ